MPSAPRHTADDYGEALLSLLTDGEAWPKEADSDLSALAYGLAAPFGDQFDRLAAMFLDQESDPRFTRALLAEWETAFGLPDDCVSEPLTTEDRIAALVQRITLEGGQSRAFFVRVAAWLGYTIEIVEFSPFMAGVSRCGDARDVRDPAGVPRWEIGPPEMRFYWKVLVADARLSWFRAGSGQAGVDPHLRIGIASDLECLLRRYKPAHTEIVFDYSGLSGAGPMAGTP